MVTSPVFDFTTWRPRLSPMTPLRDSADDATFHNTYIGRSALAWARCAPAFSAVWLRSQWWFSVWVRARTNICARARAHLHVRDRARASKRIRRSSFGLARHLLGLTRVAALCSRICGPAPAKAQQAGAPPKANVPRQVFKSCRRAIQVCLGRTLGALRHAAGLTNNVKGSARLQLAACQGLYTAGGRGPRADRRQTADRPQTDHS